MSIFSNNPKTEEILAEADKVVDTLSFAPTDEMKQDKNGTWRWRAGMVDDFGQKIGGTFVTGAPSPNYGGRSKRERAVIEFCEEASIDAAKVLVNMMMDPTASEKSRIQCATTILDRALGKAKVQTEIINPTIIQDLIRPIIIKQ